MTKCWHGATMRRAALGLYTYFEFFVMAVLFVLPMGLVALFSRKTPGCACAAGGCGGSVAPPAR